MRIIMTAGLLMALLMNAPAQAGNIVIKGSTTVLPITQAAAETFMMNHPEITVSVSGGGSGNGIKALIDGSTDIADSSRFIKDAEVTLAIGRGAYPVPHRVAMDCVVPVVHPDNPVGDIGMEALKGIYTGVITNWKEVGGPDWPVTVVSRDTSSGTYEIWEEIVLKGARPTPKALLQASSGAVAQAVSNNRYTIGYVGIGYLNKDIKALSVNGIEASAATALSGRYPITRALFMFTSGWPTGDILLFINFIVSPEGQRIARNEGFVPLYLLDQ
ncbi:phosphate ABC transporter substrate-binding protein [bacterium]|nr:phosphate ABC transporter substrate-binding protein [candidate division CSSED10-310 bacterium]